MGATLSGRVSRPMAGMLWCEAGLGGPATSATLTAMSLTIDDPEAQRLAEAIATATGQSVERVVADALRDRYATLDQRPVRASAEALLAIADSVAVFVKRPYEDHGALLYDDRGLPA